MTDYDRGYRDGLIMARHVTTSLQAEICLKHFREPSFFGYHRRSLHGAIVGLQELGDMLSRRIMAGDKS